MTFIAKKFKLFFLCSTRSNSNTLPKMDVHQPVMKCLDVLDELSYYTARASKEIMVADALVMDEWAQVLEDLDSQEADNGEQDIKFE